MSIENAIDDFKRIFVIIMIVLVVHIPNILTNTVPIDADKNPNQIQNGSVKQVPFVEYFIEHNVSQSEAKKRFFEIGVKLLDTPQPSWCMICTREILHYCRGRQMLDDHCCCDSRHQKEQLPWIPHSCYVGESCKPSTNSCLKYTEIRECCCDRELAKEWKTIHSSGSKTTLNTVIQSLTYVILFTCLWQI